MAEKEIAQLNRTNKNLQNQLSRLNENNNSLKAQLDHSKVKIKNLESKLRELKGFLDASHVFSNYYHNEEKKALKKEIEVLSQKYSIQFKHEKESLEKEINMLREQIRFFESTKSNLTAIPYMASIISDYETHSLEILACNLDWGRAIKRLEKVKSIREIRQDAKAMVEKNLEAKYQLEYLLNLFPSLNDVIETDYKDLPIIDATKISEYDRTRDWLSKEEYKNLSSIERNQLALDRYKESHNKTKWQIGRDYELYVGYQYSQQGYSVDYFGSYMGLEDLGRDLIARKDNKTLIVQCKYWSQEKTIHEKHIAQLYGTMISYCIEKNIDVKNVTGVLVTNTKLSETALKMADFLKIKHKTNYAKGEYPCIKCNIGKGEAGEKTKIYHLPFDQQYDATKIDAPGEFFAMTVKEAEEAGFRRAFKHFA